MRLQASYFVVTVLALTFAAEANATIVGSTYNFATSQSGNTLISPLGAQGTFTDPSNLGFCVGSVFGPPNTTCSNGLLGSFTFGQVTPTLDRITFRLSQLSQGGGPGSFTIDLGNFVTTDGETITGVNFNSGLSATLFSGTFNNVTWNGTDAVFTGSTSGSYIAFSGVSFVFDVTTEPEMVPEPASFALLTGALLGFGAIRRYRTLRTRSSAPRRRQRRL
jgi:hypothetical protein